MISPSGLIQIPYANCLRIFGHVVYRVCGLRGIQEDSFVVEVKYWDKTMCINLGEPGGPDYVYDGIMRPTLWMHKVSGGEELLTLLADSYYNKGEG